RFRIHAPVLRCDRICASRGREDAKRRVTRPSGPHRPARSARQCARKGTDATQTAVGGVATMRWQDLRRSGNVEDGRGGGGGVRRLGVGGGGVGLLVLAVVFYFIGGPGAVMQLLGTQSVTQSVDQPPPAGSGQ